MHKHLLLLALLLVSGIAFTGCKDKEEDKSVKNQEVTDNLIGLWKSVKVLEVGTDISTSSKHTLRFRADKTMDKTAEEGASFSLETGTFEVTDGGELLKMILTTSGAVDYKITSFTNTAMTVEYSLGGKARVVNFEKQ